MEDKTKKKYKEKIRGEEELDNKEKGTGRKH